MTNKSGYNIPAMLIAFGGKDNIISLNNCVTRLRLSIKDISLVDDEKLKNLRVLRIIYLNQHNLQIVIGPQVRSVKDELDVLI
ncbi:PTS transporter subunit EIIB [Photorhabdus antumapuensis]|uniref:PTS transporter subunit EIIB n=1 Tax=Photorhabdus antumapuensis TaxID=2862867 RepID=UPI0037C6B516